MSGEGTENAVPVVENAITIRSKLQGWKMQEQQQRWKIQE
jgi:hypothetical protein